MVQNHDEWPLAAPAETGIGHVHLKVADIDRALAFYQEVLGFDLVMRLGDSAAFVSAGGYHHLIGLNTWHSRRGTPPGRRTASWPCTWQTRWTWTPY